MYLHSKLDEALLQYFLPRVRVCVRARAYARMRACVRTCVHAGTPGWWGKICWAGCLVDLWAHRMCCFVLPVCLFWNAPEAAIFCVWQTFSPNREDTPGYRQTLAGRFLMGQTVSRLYTQTIFKWFHGCAHKLFSDSLTVVSQIIFLWVFDFDLQIILWGRIKIYLENWFWWYRFVVADTIWFSPIDCVVLFGIGAGWRRRISGLDLFYGDLVYFLG